MICNKEIPGNPSLSWGLVKNKLAMPSIRLQFLGTGASGGTPGKGKSHRLESSVVISLPRGNILIDLTRDFNRQIKSVAAITSILISHGHRDAIGGTAQLFYWWQEKSVLRTPISLYAHAQTINTIQKRFKNLRHLKFNKIRLNKTLNLLGAQVSFLKVPHALRSRQFPTLAFKLKKDKTSLVYASDIARLTKEFENFCQRTDLLVIDGATWSKKIFSHLRIKDSLPRFCSWKVKKILLTQIGRDVLPHEKLEREIRQMCPKVQPAFDGLEVRL